VPVRPALVEVRFRRPMPGTRAMLEAPVGATSPERIVVGEDRVELSPRVPKTRMLALHHTPISYLAELNGLEPSSAWLTTKCLTSRPQFRASWVG
jgi:hypothetical protein